MRYGGLQGLPSAHLPTRSWSLGWSW